MSRPPHLQVRLEQWPNRAIPWATSTAFHSVPVHIADITRVLHSNPSARPIPLIDFLRYETLWLVDLQSREVVAALDLSLSDAENVQPPLPAPGIGWARILTEADPTLAVLEPNGKTVTLRGAVENLKLDRLGSAASPADLSETWDPWRRLLVTESGELAVYDLLDGWLHYRNRRFALGKGMVWTGSLDDWPDGILGPSRRTVYVPFTDGVDSGLRAFDFTSQTTREIPLEAEALGSRGVISHDGQRLYLFFEDIWAIDLVNAKVLRRQRLEPPMYAVGAALSPNDRELYLLEGRGLFLRAIVTETFETLWQIPLADGSVTLGDRETRVSPLDPCSPALPDRPASR